MSDDASVDAEFDEGCCWRLTSRGLTRSASELGSSGLNAGHIAFIATIITCTGIVCSTHCSESKVFVKGSERLL